MNATTRFTAIAATLIASAAAAHDVDPHMDGWVSHVRDRQLEICYQHVPPGVGDLVNILRTQYVTPNKGPIRQQYLHSGTARITQAAQSGCVSAELVDGSAVRSDHARGLQQNGS